jgi:Holliday junction DNA helicase RuvA
MIGKLSGIVEHCLDDSLILSVNGVGYILNVPAYVLHQSGEGEILSLFVETITRPEMVVLYGFHTLEEKALFQKLMSVQGVGGKSALSIMSVMSRDHIIDAIIRQDAALFKQADGIGAKVATRIITELKTYADKQGSTIHYTDAKMPKASIVFDDALATLLQLGYKRYEAEQALRQVLTDTPDIALEQLIPSALRQLAGV